MTHAKTSPSADEPHVDTGNEVRVPLVLDSPRQGVYGESVSFPVPTEHRIVNDVRPTRTWELVGSTAGRPGTSLSAAPQLQSATVRLASKQHRGKWRDDLVVDPIAQPGTKVGRIVDRTFEQLSDSTSPTQGVGAEQQPDACSCATRSRRTSAYVSALHRPTDPGSRFRTVQTLVRIKPEAQNESMTSRTKAHTPGRAD